MELRVDDAKTFPPVAAGVSRTAGHDQPYPPEEWNRTRTEYPHHTCLHQLFEAQAERTPDAVAVVCGGCA